ncbi:hypothetical protein VB712_08985 [Spirulina sp. CCNP1310]|uniref:hypothetical protein n=1 Tax=Spirulina sp. CCNP1310 TaxID=3110249 RepID=UPI002B209C15|nr:hypothetical protein [Spirulina sp. CCNP1310]MEA5419361.1 hypothetical protein [Spirulina sp. CCNP1310]
MTNTYWRDEFWRTSSLGNTHLVRGHEVRRYDRDHDSVNNGDTDQSFGENQGQKTYSTTCWWCGETVFYHTNGNGDSVLFDPPLGWPWQVHPCWSEYSKGQKKISDISHVHENAQYPPQSNQYFNQNIDSLVKDLIDSPSENLIDHIIQNNFPEIHENDSTIENDHVMLLELVKVMNITINQIKLVRFGNCSVVWSESKLSNFTKLPIEKLRQKYGKFYVRHEKSAISIKTIPFAKIYRKIDSKNIHEKHQLIIWALKATGSIKMSQSGLCLTEDLLAQRMGLSVQDLNFHFSQVYTQYTSGKVCVPYEPPK